MTATRAFGCEVLADEPTPSPISQPGAPVVWAQTRTLLLDDESTAYGCVHCDYVSRNVLSIRPHLSKHKPRETRQNGHGSNGHAVNGNGSVAALLAQLGTLNEVTKDRDHWKTRALRAERLVKAVRDAVGGKA
ncbi:hypothetical protein [Amycolatopsis sp. CA-128772]|uniref:hypothetical protein n=1 Tax=Amycolatopsis sp. CA-128772 TaxID=2073159 RepID=UPI001E2FC59D|nr:hypothetical protein [Amycolatopsis sp. CA-128772]